MLINVKYSELYIIKKLMGVLVSYFLTIRVFSFFSESTAHLNLIEEYMFEF